MEKMASTSDLVVVGYCLASILEQIPSTDVNATV